MPSDIVARAMDFRAQLLAGETAQMQAMADVFTPLAESLLDTYEKAASDLAQPSLALPKTKRGAQVRQARSVSLLREMQNVFAPFYSQAASNIASYNKTVAVLAANQAYGDLTATAENYGLLLDFHRLNDAALLAAVGTTRQQQSPLRLLLETAAGHQAGAVQMALQQGVALGQSPHVTARQMAQASSIGLKRTTLIARTEQIRAVRIAALTAWDESGVVVGYKRLARKDKRTCVACLADDGAFYNTQTMLPGHPGCRCGLIPVVRGAPEPTWETGEEWLRAQPEAIQRQMLGPKVYEHWKANPSWNLGSYVKVEKNSLWGDNLRPRSFHDLRGGKKTGYGLHGYQLKHGTGPATVVGAYKAKGWPKPSNFKAALKAAQAARKAAALKPTPPPSVQPAVVASTAPPPPIKASPAPAAPKAAPAAVVAPPAPPPVDPKYAAVHANWDYISEPDISLDFVKMGVWQHAPFSTGKKASFGGVIFDKDGNYLLREPANHFDGYHWTWSKGQPDMAEIAAEDWVAAAKREVKEETGLTVKIVGVVPGVHSSDNSDNYMFLMVVDDTVPQVSMDAETNSLQWANKLDAEDLIMQTTNVSGGNRDLAILQAADDAITAISQGGLRYNPLDPNNLGYLYKQPAVVTPPPAPLPKSTAPPPPAPAAAVVPPAAPVAAFTPGKWVGEAAEPPTYVSKDGKAYSKKLLGDDYEAVGKYAKISNYLLDLNEALTTGGRMPAALSKYVLDYSPTMGGKIQYLTQLVKTQPTGTVWSNQPKYIDTLDDALSFAEMKLAKYISTGVKVTPVTGGSTASPSYQPYTAPPPPPPPPPAPVKAPAAKKPTGLKMQTGLPEDHVAMQTLTNGWLGHQPNSLQTLGVGKLASKGFYKLQTSATQWLIQNPVEMANYMMDVAEAAKQGLPFPPMPANLHPANFPGSEALLHSINMAYGNVSPGKPYLSVDNEKLLKTKVTAYQKQAIKAAQHLNGLYGPAIGYTGQQAATATQMAAQATQAAGAQSTQAWLNSLPTPPPPAPKQAKVKAFQQAPAAKVDKQNRAQPTTTTPEAKPKVKEPDIKPVVFDTADFPPLDRLDDIGGAGGSTGARIVKDRKTGKRYIYKEGNSEAHLRNEVAADLLYAEMGVEVPAVKLYERPGQRPVKLTAFVEDAVPLASVKSDKALFEKARRNLQKGMAADALLGNWDIAGASNDNVFVRKDGSVIRIDNGGSLHYRAQGAKKPVEWFNRWTKDIWTLRMKTTPDGRDNSINHDLFHDTDYHDLGKQMRAIARRKDEILAKAPPDALEALEQRLEHFRDLGETELMMHEDAAGGVAVQYRDDFAKDYTFMGDDGVFDKFSRSLDVDAVGSNVRDEYGTHWDSLGRAKGPSAADDFAKWLKKNGGDYRVISEWGEAQGRSSWSTKARATRIWVAKTFGISTDHTKVYWREGGHGYDSEQSTAGGYKRSVAAYNKVWTPVHEATMRAQHVFTYAMLRRTAYAPKNADNRTMQWIRISSDPETTAQGINEGDTGRMMRGAYESGSAYNYFGLSSEQIATNHEMPLHRILGTYWQARDVGNNSGLFLGDGENEFVAILGDMVGTRSKAHRQRRN